MAAPVVIDMGMAEPADAQVTAMVEACAKAVGDGDCHLVRDAPQGPYRAIAILTWEGLDKVRIEVGLRRDDGTEWRTRALSFQPEDAEIERFRSVGFVVGTLATEEQPPAPPPPIEEAEHELVVIARAHRTADRHADAEPRRDADSTTQRAAVARRSLVECASDGADQADRAHGPDGG